MRKTLCALAAVGLALWAVSQARERPLTPHEVFLFGPEVPVVPAVTALITSRREPLLEQANGFGNAVLVDSELGLYLTDSHVVAEDVQGAWVGSSRTGWTRVIVRDRWIDHMADLAVIRAVSTQRCRAIRALPVSDHPPEQGQILTVAAYHSAEKTFQDHRLHVYGFVQSYQVIKGETDTCVDYITCALQDQLRWRRLLGDTLSIAEFQVFYPYQIYAACRGTSFRGVVPGMSGSPALDESGAIVGLTRAYNYLSAYKARPLIAQAQRDCHTESSQ